VEALSKESQYLQRQLSQDAINTVPASRSLPAGEQQHPEAHPMLGLPDASPVEVEPRLAFGQPKVLNDHIDEQTGFRNDLTRIQGIGSFLEQQLNRIGVFTY
ncbi:hypothetical protein RZS08_64600, partial [Arthrospira platensis SPKY1]|nr:hypothetical protein [Arthrospira platensis SPKY1]